MSRKAKARHLQVLEDSKKKEFNLDKPSKITIDEAKHQANVYAMSINPSIRELPNKGGKRKRRTRKNKSKKHYKTKNRR